MVPNVRTIGNNVLKGKVAASHHDDSTNFGEFILRKLEEDPDFVGQIDAVSGKEYTYGRVRERSVRCALWMQSQGLRSRDVVAHCSTDHLDFGVLCFATLYLGAIYSPWDVRGSAEDFRHRMNISKPKMIFVSEDLAAAIAESAKRAKLDLKIIVFGRVPGFVEFDSAIAEPIAGNNEIEKFSCTPIESSDEIALIIFSSGTTGPSKGVAMSQRASIMLMRQIPGLRMAGNICFTFTSMGWISVMESIFITLFLKIPRIILPPFEEHSACALIEKYKATWVFFVPYMINKLLKSDAINEYDLSSLTTILYAGSQLSLASYRAFKKLLPNIQIYSFYGMTECCGNISMQSTKSQPCSGGEIMENAQLKVIDPDTGRTLGANEKGELLLKFARMMSCYYNDPQATARAIDEEGWIHSGDLGYYDEVGEIFVLDRLKDVIRYEGDDISPSEIEGVILSHPGVKEVAVVGQPQPDGDDLLIAFVVRAENFTDTSKWVTEIDIINLVAAELPDTRHLRAGVRFIDDLPKTPSNKIQRKVLRDLAQSTITI